MKEKVHTKSFVASCLALLVLIPVMALLLSACAAEDSTLRVCLLDVGQSEAILLSQGDQHMLIDTGSALARDDLLGEIGALDVGEFAYLLLTHPHEDHVGNARAVIEKYHVAQLMTSGAESTDGAYRLALDAAAEYDCPQNVLKKGDSFLLGNAACEVLLAEGVEGNNGSIVLRVTFGNTVLLFMSDAEAQAEGALLYLYGAEYLNCDFLKVGHHGSATATTTPFLEATTPLFAAISCGTDNAYAFPHKETLSRLAAVGAAVDRTDLSGTLVYISNGTEIRRIKE